MESANETIKELWAKAGKYYISKQYNNAIDIYLSIKEEEPKAYRELVKCYKLKKDYVNVIFICTEPSFAEQLKPDNLIDLINSYYYLDCVEGLEQFYSDYSPIFPNDFKLLISGLISLDIKQNISKAKDILLTIKNKESFKKIHILPRIKGASKKMNVIELIEFLEKKIKELDKSIPYKIEYCKQRKDNIQYKLDLISELQLRRNTQDIEDSILLCNDCFKLQSDCQEAFYYLGKAYRIKGDISKALESFNTALLQKSNDFLSIDTPDYTAIKELNKKISIKIELSNLYLNNNNYTEAKNCLNDIKMINISIKQLGIIYLKEKKLDEMTQKILRNQIGRVIIANLIIKLWERPVLNIEDAKSESSKSIKGTDTASSINSMTTVERNSNSGDDIPIGEDGFIKNNWEKKGSYYFNKNDDYPNVVKEVSKELELQLLPDDDVFLKPCETKTLPINNKTITFIYVKRCKEGNLYDYLHNKNTNLPITTKVRIIKQIANGLLTICTKFFTMIKLNPYNIFIDGKINENEEAPKIKIGDFQNISQNIEKNAQWILKNHENFYMYSFGVLIWEILTQKEPDNQLDMTIIPNDTPLYLFNLMIALINKENYPDLLKTKDTLELFNSEDSDQLLKEKYFKIYKNDNIIDDKESLNEMINTNEISSELLHYLAYRQEGNTLYLYTEYYENSLNEINLDIIKTLISVIRECKEKDYTINTLDVKYIYVKSDEPFTLKLANYGKNEELLNILYPKDNNAKNIYIQLGFLVLNSLKNYQYDTNKEYEDADDLIDEIEGGDTVVEEGLKSFIKLLYEDEPNIEEIQKEFLRFVN